MARADGNAFPVEHLGDVVRVRSLDLEGDDPGPTVGRRPEDVHAFERLELRQRVVEQLALVPLDRIEADSGEVVDRGAEANGLCDRSGAGLELVRQLVPRRPLDGDLANHVAAELEGRHRLEVLGLPPEDADPVGAHILCPVKA
jgi:hypothetical protein